MKRCIVPLLVLLGFFFSLPAGGQGLMPNYRAGEILVQFHEGTLPGTISAVHVSVQGRIQRHLPGGVQLVSLPPHLGVDEAIGIYRAYPEVNHTEPNYLVRRALTTSNDELFSHQWHLYNTGQRYSGLLRGTAGADIGAPEAWARHTGDGQVVVAIVDSGVDYLHPDLAANLWTNPEEEFDGQDNDSNGLIDDVRGWNFVDDNNDPMDKDLASHGTHIAGIIGAVGNNEIGVSGVNWAVRLMPLRALGEDGIGSIAEVIAAIDYATYMGARVINASYGYPSECTSATPSEFEQQAIVRAGEAGVLFVAAAGNSSCNNDVTPFYPASYPLTNIISVGATDPHDNLAEFSNYGANSVHLGAPGETIMSTIDPEQGGYGALSGTSMSAPMVSGAAALLMSYGPDLSMEEVRSLLLESSSAYPAIDDKVVFGRLDAGAALETASSLLPVPTNLEIITQSADHLELSWEGHSGSDASVELERRTGSGAFEPLVILPPGTLSYRDEESSDREGSVFFYRVRAVTADGVSVWSDEAGLIVPPLAPGNLLADIDPAGVLLAWEDHSQVETGFDVERRSEEGAYQSLSILAQDSIEYFDDEVTDGTTYSYRLRALNDPTGPSPYSEEVTVDFPSSSTTSTKNSSGGGGGGGCFIATAAFGSELHPRVAALRQFRDQELLPHWWGRQLNSIYLKLSPPLARWVERSTMLRAVVRSALVPVLWTVEWWMGKEKADEDDHSAQNSARLADDGS